MADERVNFVLSAQDRATATVKRLKGELGAMGGTAAKATGPLGKLSAITGGYVTPATAAVAGTVALAAGFAAAARAALEEQKGVALLTQAIRANDPAAVAQIDNIEATIKERQKLAFADDEQRESLGSLISVTGDANKALELQRTAMDLARLKGMDLATASSLIGKVYAGNLGILSRYGIQLEKGATATEAIAEIQRRAGGQAEAYAETTAGAFESAQLAIDDVVEDIGAELLPALTEIAIIVRDDLIPLFRDLGGLLDKIGGAGAWIEGLVNSFNPAAAGAGMFADEVEKATARMDALKGAAEMHMPVAIQGMLDVMNRGGPVIAAEAGKIAGMLPSEIQAKVASIRQAGADSVVAFAAGILEKQQDPGLAWEAANEVYQTAMSRTEEIAKIQSNLSSASFVRGINDRRPAVSAAFKAYASEAQERLKFLGADAFTYGSNIGISYATGIESQVGTVRTAAGKLAAAVEGQIAIKSEPPDADSPLRGITKWGGNIVKTMAEGIHHELRSAQSAAGALGGALVPGSMASGPTAYAGAGYGGGSTVIIAPVAPFTLTAAQEDEIARRLVPSFTREQRRLGN